MERFDRAINVAALRAREAREKLFFSIDYLTRCTLDFTNLVVLEQVNVGFAKICDGNIY